MRTSNDDDHRAVGKPYRDRRLGEPGTEARRRRRRQRREGGADARDEAVEATPKGAASPSKAEGHSRTPAPDAEATVATRFQERGPRQVHKNLEGPEQQAEMLKQHSPQIEESLQHTFQRQREAGQKQVTTPSRSSRLACQPLSPDREQTEERSDHTRDR